MLLPSASFLLAALLLAIIPGPALTYITARTVAGGKSVGLASVAGTTLGGIGHVVVATLGLSVIIAQSPLAFACVKYIGAGYLCYLGIKHLMAKGGPTPWISHSTVPSMRSRMGSSLKC